MIVMTEAELRERLKRLEEDRRIWLDLEKRYGSLEFGLQSEIDATLFLLGE